jgi:hypothetical protein
LAPNEPHKRCGFALTGQLAALAIYSELPAKLTALRAVAPLAYAHWYGLEP